MDKQVLEPEVIDSRETDNGKLHTSDLIGKPDRPAASAAVEETNSRPAALFSQDEVQNLRSRWEKIQIGFVDEPRRCVEEADELVATVIKRLAEVFADERGRLEHDWDKGESVSTEDLRVSLRRYRSFFDRLLSV